MNAAEVSALMRERRTVKAYRAEQSLSAEQQQALLDVMRYSPSSVNSQPWQFVIATSPEAKARIATSTQGAFAYNAPKLLNAAMVVVFCARTELDDTHLAAVLAQEVEDGRHADAQAAARQDQSRRGYVELHRTALRDLPEWTTRQTYLALGSLLFAAATMRIGATPIEGFDSTALDSELNLAPQQLRSVVLCALGERSEEDFNAVLPKSRLHEGHVLRRL
jgi:nitroreductase / dihydropteridine reductase